MPSRRHAARGWRSALLAAYVGWAYLSLLWADSTGSALEASNKMLLLLALAWTLALLPWDARTARWLIGLWALGLAVLAAFSLAGASGTNDLSKYLFEMRYQHPVGYANGNAALGAIGMIAAFGMSTHRDGHPLLSGLFLAAAALLADFTLLAQSRGSFVGAAVATAVFLIFAPDRLRVGTRLLALGGAVALAAGPLLNVYDTGEVGGALGPALDDAVAAIPVLGARGGRGRAPARRWPSGLRAGTSASSGRAGARASRALALLAAAVVAVAVVNMSSISDTVDEQWTTLTGGEYDTVEGARISNLDPYERPDYWRVAIDLFQESPVNGVGAGNFEREYTARRHEPKHSRYVHNMFLRALGEGGAVAALLLVGFFLSLFVVGALLRRRLARAPALLIATTLAIAAYFAVHLNFDWLEEIPAVASPAFALPIVALVAAAGAPAGGAVARRAAAPAARGRRGRWPRWEWSSVLALVPPYLSVRYSNRAEEVGRHGRNGAFKDLDRAGRSTPLARARSGRGPDRHRRASLRPRGAEAFEHSLTVEETGSPLRAGADRREPRRASARARASSAGAHSKCTGPGAHAPGSKHQRTQRVDPKEGTPEIQRAAHARFTTSGT